MADTATPSDFRLRLAQFTATLAPEQRREFEELLGEVHKSAQAALRNQLEASSAVFLMVDMTQ